MTTAPIDSGGAGSGLNQILSQLNSSMNRNNSVGIAEHTSAPTNNSTNLPSTANYHSESNWIYYFNQIDRYLSGSLLYLLYRLIDTILLLVGLMNTPSSCSARTHLGITSICLLIFYVIDIIIIVAFLIKNSCSDYSQLSEDQRSERLRTASNIRTFFVFFKLIPVCIGTAYSFSNSGSNPTDCALLRFCLGLVCLSTWFVILIPPSKPELPIRRSLIIESLLVGSILIINCTYFGTVASAMQQVNHSSCVYENLRSLYTGSPLKSYATAGFYLFALTTIMHMISLFMNQLCFRLNARSRKWYVSYFALQYTMNYLSTILVIYYFALGALILFQPRSGQPCRNHAPDLYRILFIWEWVRILSPLVVIPFIVIFCWLGVCFGFIMTYCLPASITVPLLNYLRSWSFFTPSLNVNLPASQKNIDKLPHVVFRQEPDQFNQLECAICQSSFETDETLKKLPCGHIFHGPCVTHWLLITRICPVCRKGISEPDS